MNRSLVILLLGIGLAGGAYGWLVGNRAASIKALEASCGPDLAWLKTEFDLDEGTFERVRVLHEAYKPICVEYCRQIDDQQRKLGELLESSETVTPEISQVVTAANDLRAQCQVEMLNHFFEVSRAMPREEGRRYLAWMQEQTLTSSHASMVPRFEGSTNHGQHVH